MNSSFKSFILGSVLTALTTLLLLHRCGQFNESGPSAMKSDTVVKLVHDTSWHIPPRPVVLQHDSFPYPIPLKVDTLEIIRHFFTEYTYVDTTRDSNILIVHLVKIAMNKIQNDSTRYKILRPNKETVITNDVILPNRGFIAIGAQVSIGQSMFAGIGPEIGYIDRKRRYWGVGYDLLHKSVSAKILFKLGK